MCPISDIAELTIDCVIRMTQHHVSPREKELLGRCAVYISIP
jgi:hypothetical protein